MIYIFLSLFLFLSYPTFVDAQDVSALETHPVSLIQLSNRSRYILIAELELGLIHVYKKEPQNRFQLITSMPVSIGKSGFGKEVEGDDKTPVGVYRITSHLTNQQLDDFYGKAAYPVNYPNAWDKLKNRTGYGIWIHAEPIGFTDKVRPFLDSNGCIVLSNNDIETLKPYLDVGYTYAIFTPRIELRNIDEIEKQKSHLLNAFSEWNSTFQKLDEEAFLELYSTTFNYRDVNRQEWIKLKRKQLSDEKNIEIKISNLSLFNYPGEKNLVWFEFYQTYKSNTGKKVGWKQQLWRLEADNVWRIIYEGDA